MTPLDPFADPVFEEEFVRQEPVYYAGVITAQEVAGKPGFVYSPHTEEPLEIDVRDFLAGERARCPYTKQAFVVPGLASIAGETATVMEIASTPVISPRTEPSSPQRIDLDHTVFEQETPRVGVVERRDVATDDNTVAEKPSGGLIPGRIPRDGNPAPTVSEMLAEPVKTGPAVPVGERVPGKAHYVYSPFAERNQIVDVEGYEPGSKVKCPYTGKIFTVPSAVEAE